MSWVEDKYDDLREDIWEHIDMLFRHGITAFGVTKVWRSLRFHGPTEYNAVERVLKDGVKAGVLYHPERGVYVIRGTAPGNYVWPPECEHRKTGPHYKCEGPTRIFDAIEETK